MNALTLSPELASSLTDLKVGAEETIEVTLKVTKNDESGFEAEVTAVDYDDSKEEAAETPEEETAEGEPAEAAEDADDTAVAAPKKGPAGNPALMIVLGKHTGK